MDDLGVGKVGQITPAPQGIIEEPVHIGDLGVAIEGMLQSLEAAALDAHFLPVRQRGIDPRLAQRKHETVLIRLSQIATGYSSSGFGGVKLGISWCSDVASNAEQGSESIEGIETAVEAESEFV